MNSSNEPDTQSNSTTISIHQLNVTNDDDDDMLLESIKEPIIVSLSEEVYDETLSYNNDDEKDDNYGVIDDHSEIRPHEEDEDDHQNSKNYYFNNDKISSLSSIENYSEDCSWMAKDEGEEEENEEKPNEILFSLQQELNSSIIMGIKVCWKNAGMLKLNFLISLMKEKLIELFNFMALNEMIAATKAMLLKMLLALKGIIANIICSLTYQEDQGK